MVNGGGTRRGGNGGNGWGGRFGERPGTWGLGVGEVLRGTELPFERDALEEAIRTRPMLSLAVAFGIGLLIGLGSRE